MKTRFSNSYLSLPEQFYQRVSPTPVEAPAFVALNEPLAEELGLESSSLRSPEWLAVLAGNRVPEGAQPVALAYSGHQFGHFVPLLGDGRAVLIGELTTPQGLLYDLQLKGSGRTPILVGAMVARLWDRCFANTSSVRRFIIWGYLQLEH